MYDRTVSGKLRGKEIEYGIFEGSSTVFFIKVGQDGNIYGYNDKYMILAEMVHDRFGYTCVTASNPFDGEDPIGHAFSTVDEMKGDCSVYYMGHSNGARAGALFGYRYDRIKKMVLSDSPLEDCDIDEINEALRKFKGDVTMVYGEFDDSADRIHLLDETVKVEMIPGEDHNYTKDMQDLYDITFRHLFGGE